MIQVSNEFRELMRERTDFRENAIITLTDGTTLTLDESDFTLANNSITDGARASTFPLGVAISRSIQIELTNDDDRLSDYDFFGAKIRLYLTYPLSNSVEKIEMGMFTVVTPETEGNTIIVTANDEMYKADKPFETSITFPATAQALLRDICSMCGIPLYSTEFDNDIFLIESKPSSDLTFRQIIGYIAMIAGGNARINRSGYLEIIPYSFEFKSESYHELKNWNTLTTDTNDITITGVRTTKEVETEDENGAIKSTTEPILNGAEGYVLSVENPLSVGKEDDLLAYLATVLVGKSFRRFEGDHIAYPLAEFMDLAKITDRKGNIYDTIITDINFVFFSFTTLKNSAESVLGNSSAYATPSNSAIIAARKLVERETAARELAVQSLNNLLEKSSGMYSTDKTQPDGSTIRYLHDKPTLEESANVIKITSDAIGFSTDGGKTYPYGITVDGETILRIIQAEGISADWVKIENKTITEVIESGLSDAQEYADQIVADYANTIAVSINSLQAQIDGQIETHYYDYEPTLTNIPASEWTTEEERIKHEGDLFFWKSTGYAYRFFKNGDIWEWTLVQDTNITKALAASAEAQATANAKRRVFVTTPTPPYDTGDLWTDGTDIKTCTTARASGSQYVSTDWEVLNNYANNGVVNELSQKANNLEESVTTAQAAADAAQESIDNLQVGGRNLLPDSDRNTLTKTSGSYNRYFSDTGFASSCAPVFVEISDPPASGIKYAVEAAVTAAFSGARNLCWYNGGLIPLIDGETYTMSCYARVTSGSGGIRFQYGHSPHYNKAFQVTGAWKQYSHTFTFDASTWNGAMGTRIYIGGASGAYVGVVQTCGFKLERGTIPTDWTPAPEDAESAITAVTERTTALETSLSVVQGAITAKVWQSDITAVTDPLGTQVTTLADNYSALSLTVDGIQTRVSAVETTTDGLSSRMSVAESAITQQADQISLKVSRDGIISEINQTSEAVTINANRINLTDVFAQDITATGTITGATLIGPKGEIGGWVIGENNLGKTTSKTDTNGTTAIYSYVVQAPSDDNGWDNVLYSRHRASENDGWMVDFYLNYDGYFYSSNYISVNGIYCRSMLTVTEATVLSSTLTCNGAATFGDSVSTYGYQIPRTLWGRVSATAGSDFTVTFSKAFPGIPTLEMTVAFNSYKVYYARIKSVTASGFTGHVDNLSNTDTDTVTVHWAAHY